MKTTELFEKLEKAKSNVLWLLEHDNANIDFKGLSYWASEVERLREEIKESL